MTYEEFRAYLRKTSRHWYLEVNKLIRHGRGLFIRMRCPITKVCKDAGLRTRYELNENDKAAAALELSLDLRHAIAAAADGFLIDPKFTLEEMIQIRNDLLKDTGLVAAA